ncbi:hypothetical protein AAW14_11600 [Streptomyces hygroscopicus]|uniref:hypothetical protein n=1 Tax=Streptomyces hygroscopicus TaxID=1912 RepID=UPI00223FA487|nr:hypothetical protein [Streptomyces hygroscopicus]MCW7942671.1 hypothetical protein [Streptomyces hygroscopicus]
MPSTSPTGHSPRARCGPDHRTEGDRLHEPRAAGDVLALAERLFRWADARDWAGPDPYDGLTGPLGRLAGHRVLRQALLQTVKRSPVDLRPVLGIRPLRTATATGCAAGACARLSAFPLWQDRALRLGRWTAAEQLTGRYAGLWRYEFDVQTRWSYYPASVPNLVATTFCADGCLDSGTLDDDAVRSLARGLLEHLYNGEFFTYTPTSGVLVHNANLMGAALAARLARAGALPAGLADRLADAARGAVEVSLNSQRSDGCWPYGRGPRLGWVDGFHTGYVLLRLEQAGALLGMDVRTPLERGAVHYLRNLFDGPLPLYFAGGRTRRDPNNDATAVRMAAWATERGFATADFAWAVLAAVVDRYPGLGTDTRTEASRGNGALWQSPRWSAAPLLDALTALHAVVAGGSRPSAGPGIPEGPGGAARAFPPRPRNIRLQ